VSDALLVSQVVLWAAVVLLAGAVAALARQIGVLYERVAPAGALMAGRGPRVGEAAPVVHAEALAGGTQDVGGARGDGRGTLVFFLSPTCPVCKELLPAVRSVARRERGWLDVVLASDGPRAEHEPFVRREGLEGFPYLLSAPLGITYEVNRLPYAVLLDGAGVLRAKGLVNSREHLESLFEARERGVASLQDWLAREVETREVRAP
jgi:methylamine dehydrogenase accessory protein MauD